jgi:IS4 transposase
MHAAQLLHKFCSDALVQIHKKRLQAVINATQSLLIGKRLSLSQIGRHLPGNATEKDNIHKVNRLLGNKHLQAERFDFYKMKATWLIKNLKNIVISVDWSATDKRKSFQILRASISIKGRAEVIYEEVHKNHLLNSNIIHKQFLRKLREIIPLEVQTTILTDAGFCNPWFKEVKRMGFDFIGRTKINISYAKNKEKLWDFCKTLDTEASHVPKRLEKAQLAKTNPLLCDIVYYKEKIKGRIHKTRGGKKCESSQSKRTAKQRRAAWILVTSLSNGQASTEKIVKLYKQRMQIEENFRDTKSLRFGFSLRESLSNDSKRIELLLLFAMLASFICWILSLVAKSKNLQYQFQANTVRNREVLSCVYLGCQLVRKQFTCLLSEAFTALETLRQMILEAASIC